jgi:hypothetical protein
MPRGSQIDDIIDVMELLRSDLLIHNCGSIDKITLFRRDAIERLAEERCLRSPTTLIDSLTRRLDRISMGKFDELVLFWWINGDSTLMDYMLTKSFHYPHKYQKIKEIFNRKRLT